MSWTTTPAGRPGRLDRFHLTLLAATPTGYRNLVKLCSAGYLDGFQRGKPSVDFGQIAAHAEGIVALTGCLQSRFCQALLHDRLGPARAHAQEMLDAFGAENVYFEVQKNGLAAQDKVNEGIVRIARELGRPLVGTADVHYLRREDYHHHAALLCVQTKSTLSAPKMTFDTNEFYLRSSRGDGRAVRRVAGGAAHLTGDRRAVQRRDRARAPAHPALLHAAGRERGGVPAGARAGRAGPALRRSGAGRGAGTSRVRARCDRADGVQRLFPDRLGLRQARQGPGHRRGPGARLGGRVDRRLRAGHHRRRPAPLRPAVRAVPQPGAGVDAGHRHRLLGAGPGASDPLRHREVRQGVGGADRHVRQDVPPRGHARRRARARPRLRRRRPAGEADPGPDHGPRRRASRTA